MTEEQRAEIKYTKREADKFIDSIVETLNEDYDEKEVTVAMSKREKYAYVR